MSLFAIGVLVILLLFVLFLLGLEIGVAMGLAGFVGFAAVRGMDAALSLVAKDIYSVFSTYGFTVIPIFVLMGQVGSSGGVARKLYDATYKFIGHIPAGVWPSEPWERPPLSRLYAVPLPLQQLLSPR